MKNSICIDGGGSTTSFILYSPEGNELAKSIDETIHLQYVAYDKAKKILSDNVRILCKSANIDVKDVVISAGLAGYGSNEVIKKQFDILFDEVFSDQEIYLTSDGHIALLGALDAQDGILIIAGTGSIAYRLKDKQLSRAGGWGYLLGDEGSAYSIALNLLKVFTKQADGRLEKTPLYDGVMRLLDLKDPYDIVKYTYTILQGSRKEIALIAKVNYQLALENDPYAIQIIEDATKELAAHVLALADEDEGVHVSYVGGVFNSKEFVLTPLAKMIGNNILVEPKNSPEFGAYLYYKIENK